MGIPGARSLLDSDPRRYGAPWRCNWPEEKKDPEGSKETTNQGNKEADNNTDNTTKGTARDDLDDTVKKGLEAYIVLVDGMSLLYHVVVNSQPESVPTLSIHGSPSQVKDEVSRYISKILLALPDYSELRIFMDGLAPKAKIPTQIDRLRSQALRADTAARREKDAATQGNLIYSRSSPPKTLDPLAEWAFVEAIEDISSVLKRNGSSKFLELHRPSRGEAEAYIDFWMTSRIPKGVPMTNVFIFADDTDFLVYQNCPGFIPLSTLEIQQDISGDVRLSGFQYSRQKFLDSFLPSPQAANADDIMPVVAALAGCDYALHPGAEKALERARSVIVKSDLGGLREKARNNPSKSQQLTAILRYVAHFVRTKGEYWADALCSAVVKKKGMNGANGNGSFEMEEDPTAINPAVFVLKEAFLITRKTYFRTLTLPDNPIFEKRPTSVEIRRLLEYGIFYCRPIIESWEPLSHRSARKRSLDDTQYFSEPESRTFALVITPPFTRQVAAWITEGSLWRMPHFYQARMRLHCLLVQFARTGGSYAFEGGQLRLSPMWTNEDPQVVEYVRSHNRGGNNTSGEPPLRMLERPLETPSYEDVSAGWADEAELLSGSDAVDRSCLFCILGNIRQATPALNARLKNTGTVFLTSLFLPFNLAFLVILMGTGPGLETIDLTHVNPGVRAEVNKVWPLMSMACYHGMFIANTLLSLFGTHSDEQKRSNLTCPGKIGVVRGSRVSDAMRYEEAVWIWSIIRSGADLERLRSDDSDDSQEIQYAMDYLDAGLARLKANLPQTAEWELKIHEWRRNAKVLWIIWWEVFNVALTCDASARIDEW